MRRAFGLLLCLLALAPAAAARPPRLHLQPPVATWFAADGLLFVRTAWTPQTAPTTVTVQVAHYGRAIATARVTGWLLGHRQLVLDLSGKVASGTLLDVRVSASSAAGQDARVVEVPIP